ncbi:MAG: C39 family peptidase [Actinobacteria bacterium]|nr:C39 family peptidase [Actinomycetota bacterium]
MSAVGARSRPRRATFWRRRLAALAAVVGAALLVALVLVRGVGGGGTEMPAPPLPRFVSVKLGGQTLAHVKAATLRRPAVRARIVASVPAHQHLQVGKATIDYDVARGSLDAALRRAARAGAGKQVVVPRRPVAAAIDVPMIAQRLRDDCEATALSMVLGYAGHPADQLLLQRQVAHAKPLDPTVGPNGEEVWGDPVLGFVGRADGGGPAGGFGVYQGPIKALAARHGLEMDELSGSSPQRLYAALLAGHPILAWVALAEGPYATWTSPAGRPVKVNYGEHAVVLTGVDSEGVKVNDPLSGERLTWSKAEFERMWAGLGHRALAA